MFDRDSGRDVIIRRLKRVEGQVRGVIRMVEDEKRCEDILTQVAAARSAMDRVGIMILTQRMRECLASKQGESDEDAVEEAIDIFLRFSSSTGHVTPEA